MIKLQAGIWPYLAATSVSFIFGFSFLFTKAALDYTEPFQLLGFRFALAGLLLTVLKMLGIIQLQFKGKRISSLLTLALFQPVLYFMGETWGVKWTSASEAGMIIALIPVVVTAMAAIFLREKLHPWQIVAVVASVAGVFLIVLGQGNLSFGEQLWGILALLGAVLAAGAYTIFSKHLSAEFTPIEITFVMMWVGAIIFNILGVGQSARNGTISNYLQPLSQMEVWWAVLYLGVLSSVTAFFLLNYTISKLKVSQTAGFNNLTTVVAVSAGVLFAGEPFGWVQALGVVLILWGVWGTNRFVVTCQLVESTDVRG